MFLWQARLFTCKRTREMQIKFKLTADYVQLKYRDAAVESSFICVFLEPNRKPAALQSMHVYLTASAAIIWRDRIISIDGQIQCTRSSLSTDKIYILLYKYNVVSEKTPERVIQVLYIKTPPMNI
jgi:hypothetical protein